MLAQRRLYQHGWMVAYLMATNIGDHLAAIADTATPDEPRVFAHMTLARAALEGAARLAYLLHPVRHHPRRPVRRGLNVPAGTSHRYRTTCKRGLRCGTRRGKGRAGAYCMFDTLRGKVGRVLPCQNSCRG